MTTPAKELATTLAEGACLLETSSTPTNSLDLKSVLRSRLLKYYDCLENQDGVKKLRESSTLEEVQLLTAKEALSVVQKVHNILDIEDAKTDGTPDQVPSIGTRDLAQLRTLLSLIFKWGIEPVFNRVALALPGPPINTTNAGAKIVDVSQNSDDYRFLAEFVTSVFLLIFPRGVQGQISQTLITTTILSRHVSDLLNPSIALGWLPEPISSSSLPIIHEMRFFVIHLLKFLSPAQTISALGTIISAPCPAHVRKTGSFLLTKQLLRPHGVRGLLDVMFGEETLLDDGIRLQKQEHIARILMTIPANMKATEYYSLIFPRVIHLLSSNRLASHRQAASFTIYRAIISDEQAQYQDAASIILAMLHDPFLKVVDPSEQRLANTMEPSEALSSISTLISNTEPSPIFISKILSPILPSLYLLSYNLAQFKTADPQLKASINGLLLSWGKIVDQPEGINVLWSILEARQNSEWKYNTDGQLWRFQLAKGPSSLSILMPNDIQQDTDSVDTNLFDFYPDPAHFVDFLKTIERGDIVSDIFIQILESYRSLKSDANEDSMRTLHKLQIIMQMQKRLLSGDTASNILRNPDHLLSFILHVLESATIPVKNDGEDGFKNERFRLDEDDDDDSDDETPDSEVVGPDDEMIETAISLLLAILEANVKPSTNAYPIFDEIFSKMEILAINGSSSVRPLAREARLVITARLADTPKLNKLSSHEEQVQQTYQKALKLLQDPILPVRAHGLLLLRHLVSPPASDGKRGPQSINQSLVPAILSIFLQAVQDDDSYIFLNAVQGLAAMVDTFGKDVLQSLMYSYAGGLDGLGAGNLSQQDVDIRTRVGEALNIVINRCGSALGIYVDILVPRLFAIVRSSDIPTALRTSSLSLLSTCINTFPLAVLPYVEDLSSAMIDLLQIESVPLAHDHKAKTKAPINLTGKDSEPSEDSEPIVEPQTMDSNPTSKNPKFPPLRRAAIHFLSLLIQVATRQLYDQLGTDLPVIFPRVLFDRLRVTLGYVSSSDADNVVRLMARDATEGLKQLQRATLGI
ncbi:hypothetical protein BYT27DRAFT_6419485 [Phlegmacium glaucopus]|nr:hypothetical protein BYT27DRAFT_6419485 [Phlegmacium glaucopus]